MNLHSAIKRKKLLVLRFGFQGFRRNIIENIELLVKSLNDLQVELSGFRSEMKEFKKAVEKRVDHLDSRQLQCQVNPASCANARRLEEHMKNDAGKQGRITGIIACVISCFNFAIVFLKEFL